MPNQVNVNQIQGRRIQSVKCWHEYLGLISSTQVKRWVWCHMLYYLSPEEAEAERAPELISQWQDHPWSSLTSELNGWDPVSTNRAACSWGTKPTVDFWLPYAHAHTCIHAHTIKPQWNTPTPLWRWILSKWQKWQIWVCIWETGPFIRFQVCKIQRILGKKVWKFLRKFQMELSYDVSIYIYVYVISKENELIT